MTRPRDIRVNRMDDVGPGLLVISVPLDERSAVDSLTPAERFVAYLAAHGATNAQIARRRATSARTVANQLASIFKKLRVGSRHELAARYSTALAAPSPSPP
ncbi:MAG: response regulator transcription factor [Sandaracinaceae bacterium]